MYWIVIVLIILIIVMQITTSNYDTDWRLTMKRGQILNPMTNDDLNVFSQISDDDYVNYRFVVLQDDPYFIRTYPTILHGLITKDNKVYGPYLKNFMSELSQSKTSLRNALIAYETHVFEFGLTPRTVSEIRAYIPKIPDRAQTIRVTQAMSTLTDEQLLFTFNRMYVTGNLDPMIEYLIMYEPVNKNLTKFLNEKVLNQTPEVQKNIDYTYINTYIKPYLPTSEFIIQQASAPSPSPSPASPSPASPSPSPVSITSSSSSKISSTGLLYSGLSSSCSLVIVAILFVVMMKKKQQK